MRALFAAALLLAGCHDYDHFREAPDGAAFDLSGADLLGCPQPGPPPVAKSGCTVYTFESGLPGALTTVTAKNDVTVDSACGMLHVVLPAGTSHDLWIDDLGAVRVEEKTARSGAFTLSARVHGALDRDQKFSGVYATDGSDRFVSVQTSAESTGLHDHDIVFSYPSASAEQAMYPGAVPATGDSYSYQLQRMSDGTTFVLTGSQSQTLTVTTPAALTPGVVVGNCCGATAPDFEAYIEWMVVCQ